MNDGPPMSNSTWRKARASTNAQACVEVHGSHEWLRDSKHVGPVLRCDLAGLVAAVKAGRVS